VRKSKAGLVLTHRQDTTCMVIPTLIIQHGDFSGQRNLARPYYYTVALATEQLSLKSMTRREKDLLASLYSSAVGRPHPIP
jgi:hypothetical protein